MKNNKVEITVRELVNGYVDNAETGEVIGFGGKLNIRPPYQRAFVYADKQRNAVLETVIQGFPLSIMYWAKTGDDTFEVLDGQQRTISICQYCNDEFALNFRYFHNLTQDEKDVILNYKLDIYQCEGTDKEKLEWFKRINVYGEKLTDQELRNAVYAGPWLSDAKKRFSARNCAAERLAKNCLNGSGIRQDYLETAISWIAAKEGINIETYMAQHQFDSNAGALWAYFSSVFEWVKSVFPEYMHEMKGVQWGLLYNEFGTKYPDVDETKDRVIELMIDDDVTAKKGVFEYVLSGREKALSIRAFTPNMKREAYERQHHKCPYCENEGIDKEWDIKEMEADHVKPWHEGGKTIAENCVMLCKAHNRAKGGK